MSRYVTLGSGMACGLVFGVYISQNYEVPRMMNLARVFSQEAGRAVENIDKVERLAESLQTPDSEKDESRKD